MYSEEEILVKIREFYKMYEELLRKYSFNYVVLDGNDSIENINRIMKNEIDNLINGAQKEYAR